MNKTEIVLDDGLTRRIPRAEPVMNDKTRHHLIQQGVRERAAKRAARDVRRAENYARGQAGYYRA